MTADESQEQHRTRRKEESDIVETDKAHTDGLFKGCFETRPRVKCIVDPSDGVTRCPDCNWEIEDDACPQCGLEFDADGYAILEDQLLGGNAEFSDIGSDALGSDAIAELYDMELDHSLASEDDEDDEDDDDDSLDGYGIHGHHLFHHGPDMGSAFPSYHSGITGPMPPRRHIRYAEEGEELSSDDEDDELDEDMQQFLEDDEDDEDIGSLQDFVVDDVHSPQNPPRRNVSGASTASLNTRNMVHDLLSDEDEDDAQQNASNDSSDGEGNIISSQHKSRASRATGRSDRPLVIDSDSESDTSAFNTEVHDEDRHQAVERSGWSPLDEGDEQSVIDQSSNANDSDSDITIGESEGDREEDSATPQHESSRFFDPNSGENLFRLREASTTSSPGRTETSDPEENSDIEVSEVTDQDGDLDMGRSHVGFPLAARVSSMFAGVGGASRGQKRASGSEDEESDRSIVPARRRRRRQEFRHQALPDRQPTGRSVHPARQRRAVR